MTYCLGMGQSRKAGRPLAISLDMLEEAACELFFEQGYASTSVSDITQRAGVSRATFFNYVSAKSDLLWISVDAALEQLASSLSVKATGAATVTESGTARRDSLHTIRQELGAMVAGLKPCTAVLALANADIMGLVEELDRSSASRQQRLTWIIAGALLQGGWDQLSAEAVAAAHAGAFLAALRAWSKSNPGRTSLSDFFAKAVLALDFMTANS